MPGCAHNIPAQAAMVDAIDRAISATHPSTDARRTSTARSHTHSRTPVVQQAKRREFFCLFCQHAATALPRLPCHTPSCCALLYRGRALSMRPVQDAPRSRRPPGPPGRLRLQLFSSAELSHLMSVQVRRDIHHRAISSASGPPAECNCTKVTRRSRQAVVSADKLSAVGGANIPDVSWHRPGCRCGTDAGTLQST